MKTFFFFLLVCFSLPLLAQEPNQNLIMACKPGGYSISEIRAFALNPVGRLNLNYREDMVDIINIGREKCGCDGVLDVRHVNYIMDSSYIADNVELFDFKNSGADGTEILYRTVAHYVGKVVIYRDRSCPNECLIPFIKDTCGNLIKAELIKPLEQEVPAFARQGTTSAGGKDPSNSGNEKPEKKDTVWIPEVGPIVTSSGKKPTSWQEQEYERQQQKEKQQGTKPDFDSLSFLSNGGNYISNSFNNTTYILPSSGSTLATSQDDSGGQFVYCRGVWEPASYYPSYTGTRIRIYSGIRVAYGVTNYPAYYPGGLPYDGYWDGHYYRSALDGRTLAQDNRGNWQYQGGPSPNVDYSVLNQNRYKPETTGYTSNSYHPSTHNGGYYGPRRF